LNSPPRTAALPTVNNTTVPRLRAPGAPGAHVSSSHAEPTAIASVCSPAAASSASARSRAVTLAGAAGPSSTYSLLSSASVPGAANTRYADLGGAASTGAVDSAGGRGSSCDGGAAAPAAAAAA
jgi:hypothetical protein